MTTSKNLKNNIFSNTYESSGSKLFKVTTGIQSRPDALEEISKAMILLAIYEV